MPVIVDGSRGEITLDPDEETLSRARARAEIHRSRARHLEGMRDVPSVTLDGAHIHLAANVEMLEEIPIAVDLGAESVGLFRTEFLYLERADLPSEEEQHAHAVAALKSVQGASHHVPHARSGRRQAARLGAHPERARTRPWACARSATRCTRSTSSARSCAPLPRRHPGPTRILFPLISGVAELRAAKQICAQVCADLAREGVPHDRTCPWASWSRPRARRFISDLLAAECDFLSIGTNDLIQYSLAADRDDEHVGYLYHPLHPAILRSLKQVVQGASPRGKPVAMCGDMAGDPLLAWVLIGLGPAQPLDGAPPIPVLKSIIRSTAAFDAERVLAQAMSMHTESEVERSSTGSCASTFPLEVNEGEG
jgi:phosphotransferase system enzyme I (PtsI)